MTIMKHNDIDRELSYVEARAHLEKERATGKPTPQGRITTLKLKQIALAPSVFQVRQIQDSYEHYISDRHSETLKACIGASPDGTLEPITVWWSGRRWIAIDGHHRIEAYRRLDRERKGKLGDIPVTVFEGTLGAAISRSIELNTRDKLPMTHADKANAAWRLIVEGDQTQAEISRITTIHRNTLSTMSKVAREMKRKYPLTYLDEALGMTWDEARRSEIPQARGDFDGYESEMNRKVAKSINNVRGRKPFETFVPFMSGGLALVAPNAPQALLKHLIGEYPEIAREELEWQTMEPEF